MYTPVQTPVLLYKSGVKGGQACFHDMVHEKDIMTNGNAPSLVGGDFCCGDMEWRDIQVSQEDWKGKHNNNFWIWMSIVLVIVFNSIYNTIDYGTVLDITWVKDGFQKCIDCIEKWP